MADNSTDAAFRVSGFNHFLGGLIANHPRFWIGLGNMETKALADEIAPIAIEAPVYVAGLARAGTTIALEFWPRTRMWQPTSIAIFRRSSRPTGGTGSSSAAARHRRSPRSAPTRTGS